MKGNYPRVFNFSKFAILVILLCSFQFSFAQDINSTEDGNWHEVVWNPSGLPEVPDNVTLSHSLIIEKDSIVEINNLNIGQTGAIKVLGTLLVNGSIDMDNNGSSFEMGDSARVIIFGDFLASNKVDVSISSYLIIHGSFNKKGSAGQGSLDVENGNIYIYGEVDGWPNFGDCEEEENYSGTPEESGSCDYGNEDDLVNNPDIPDELLELNNCYDLSNISNQIVCEGATSTFNVSAIDDVFYEWQEKIGDNDWNTVSTDSTSNTFSLVNTSTENNGNFYRVVVKPVDPENSSCKISISRKVSLRVVNAGIWTGKVDTNWNNNANWSCNYLPTTETNVTIPDSLASGNYPVISSGTNAISKNLVIEEYASVEVDGNWLRISGVLTNDGLLNTKTGSVSFEGTSAQFIPNSAFENNRIQNLLINNTSGVTSKAIIEITGTLKVEAGNFDTGNDLTLISDANQTALIDGSGNGEIIGLVSMQRYLDKAFGYKYFSSPFKNSVVADFGPFMDFQDPGSDFPNFYRYNENRRIDSLDLDATGWEPYIEAENSLNIAEGYALNFGASTGAQTIDLIGEVNIGTIPTRQLENNHRKYTRGFHLVGNPYPSPIDWNAAQGWTRTNIDDGIYFFTSSDDSQYTGTYTAYVNDISTGDGSSSNIIPSMQGFFIKVSDSDNQSKVTGNFGMDNNVRVTDFDQEFLRTQIADQKSLIRLEAGFTTATRKDPMVIYFSSFATPNFEKEMDAHKLMNTDPAVPSFYNITQDHKELAINAIPYPENAGYKKIPLGINAEKSGKMKINLASLENISSNLNIYLIDHAKGIGQNLSKKSEYTFSTKAGTHNSRFELMFSEEEVTNPAIAFNEPFDVSVMDGDVIVKLNLEKNQQGILRASTMTGQILQIKSGGGLDEVIFDGITSDGVYIINLQLGKSQYAKKVIIKK